MHIGYLTYGLDRAPTGIGRYAVALVNALAALPDAPTITLLTTEDEDRHGLWQRFPRQALPGCRLLPSLLAVGNAAISAATARRRLDIVHDPNGIAPFLGPRMGARRIVTIHDAVPFVHPEVHNRLDNWRFRRMLPHAVHHADMVLTDSQDARQDIQHYLAVPDLRLRVVHCGVDARFRPIDDGPERQAVLKRYGITAPYLLYVGGLNARKNIGRLFEAYAWVRNHYPDLTLVIGGKRQWQNTEMDATFQRLDLDKYVQFTGYLGDADLPALYSAAVAFIFPSVYEGFGLPPLEAMVCGTPTITSTASSLPEVVGDAALQVDPFDVAALAEAIERIISDEALRADLQRRGPERATQFTWERAAQATMAIYRELLHLVPENQ